MYSSRTGLNISTTSPGVSPIVDAVLDAAGDHPDVAVFDDARLIADGEGEFALQAHADLLMRMAVRWDHRVGV